MLTRVIEATNGRDWGLFVVARLDESEWTYASQVVKGSLLHLLGWRPGMLWVLDIQAREGVALPFGDKRPDVSLRQQHGLQIGPLFEPFVNWLVDQEPLSRRLEDLPSVAELPKPPHPYHVVRRKGK